MKMKNYNENDIRVAAYFNWLNSGCQNGNDLQNWNLALQQIAGNGTTSKKSSKSTTSKAAAIKTISKTSASSKKKK